MTCQAHTEKGGVPLAKSRSRSHTEKRHEYCKRPDTTSRFIGDREIHLCAWHARRVDDGLPINLTSDW